MALSASGQLNRSRKKVSAVPARVRMILSISLMVRAFQKVAFDSELCIVLPLYFFVKYFDKQICYNTIFWLSEAIFYILYLV